jgi:hypothetical protein
MDTDSLSREVSNKIYLSAPVCRSTRPAAAYLKSGAIIVSITLHPHRQKLRGRNGLCRKRDRCRVVARKSVTTVKRQKIGGATRGRHYVACRTVRDKNVAGGKWLIVAVSVFSGNVPTQDAESVGINFF